MLFIVCGVLWYELFQTYISVEIRLEFDQNVKLAQVKEAA